MQPTDKLARRRLAAVAASTLLTMAMLVFSALTSTASPGGSTNLLQGQGGGVDLMVESGLPDCREWRDGRCVLRVASPWRNEALAAAGGAMVPREALPVQTTTPAVGEQQSFIAAQTRLEDKYASIMRGNARLESLVLSKVRPAATGGVSKKEAKPVEAISATEGNHEAAIGGEAARKGSSATTGGDGGAIQRGEISASVPGASHSPALTTSVADHRPVSVASGALATAESAVEAFKRSIAGAIGRMWLTEQSLKAEQRTSSLAAAAVGHTQVTAAHGQMLADGESVRELEALGLEDAGRLTGAKQRGPGDVEGQFQGGFPSDEIGMFSAGSAETTAPKAANLTADAANSTAPAKPRICWYWCGDESAETSADGSEAQAFYASEVPKVNASTALSPQAFLAHGGGNGYEDEFKGKAGRLRAERATAVTLQNAGEERATVVKERMRAFLHAFETGGGGGQQQGNASVARAPEGLGKAVQVVDEPGVKPRCGWPLQPCGTLDGFGDGDDGLNGFTRGGGDRDAFQASGLDAELQAPLQFTGRKDGDESVPKL